MLFKIQLVCRIKAGNHCLDFRPRQICFVGLVLRRINEEVVLWLVAHFVSLIGRLHKVL